MKHSSVTGEGVTTPTMYVTKTVVRYRVGGKVVREVEVPPLPQPLTRVGDPRRLADLVEAALDAGLDPADLLPPLPPWLKLTVPRPPAEAGLREVWRSQLRTALRDAYDVGRRVSAMERYAAESLRRLSKVLGPEEYAEVERLVRTTLEKARRTTDLSELVELEKEVYEVVEDAVRRARARATPA